MVSQNVEVSDEEQMKIYMEKCTHAEVASMLLETHKMCRRNGCRDLKFKMVDHLNFFQAFQRAENGKMITNKFLKMSGQYLKYVGQGYFDLYGIQSREQIHLERIKEFSLGYIISTTWEVVENPWEL